MSEIERHMRIETIDTAGCLRLEPVTGFESRPGAGFGISSVTVEPIEGATPLAAFWGTVASCNLFDVIIRRRG